ncbi:MAG TPA: hypothetical protein VIL74_12060 [Pyrinomonadaceae bacterium]|jgi:hypothetical protein
MFLFYDSIPNDFNFGFWILDFGVTALDDLIRYFGIALFPEMLWQGGNPLNAAANPKSKIQNENGGVKSRRFQL